MLLLQRLSHSAEKDLLSGICQRHEALHDSRRNVSSAGGTLAVLSALDHLAGLSPYGYTLWLHSRGMLAPTATEYR